MNEEFAVPEEFENLSATLYKKDSMSKREFVDLCLLATKLIETNWGMRQGMAYHIAGAMQYKSITQDELLDEIVSQFGVLELPDHQIAVTESEVREKWEQVKDLVLEADRKFTA